jgi:hypothetical protein
MSYHRPALLFLAVGISIGMATPLSGQIIHGRLLQEGTLAPLTDASVQLMDAQGNDLNRIVITNAAGTFTMRVDPGRYTLRIRRIGFNPLVTPVIALAADEIFEATYRVSPATVRLATQRITARRRLEEGRDGFARRKDLGLGIFLNRADLGGKDQRDFASLMMDVDGIRVEADRKITSTEGWRCLYFMVNAVPVSSDPRSPPGTSTYPTLEDLVPTGHDVMAIEIYREFKEVPPEFRMEAWPGSNSASQRARPTTAIGGRRRGEAPPCGLVSVWTRPAW